MVLVQPNRAPGTTILDPCTLVAFDKTGDVAGGVLKLYAYEKVESEVGGGLKTPQKKIVHFGPTKRLEPSRQTERLLLEFCPMQR